MRRERRHQHLVVERVLARHQVMHLGRERLERGHGVEPLGFSVFDRVDMRLRAHLEKFVEVRRDDAQKAQALEQRHVVAHGPVEHALVEGKDAVVAVEQGDGLYGHYPCGAGRMRFRGLCSERGRILQLCWTIDLSVVHGLRGREGFFGVGHGFASNEKGRNANLRASNNSMSFI
jgi:hypothetical protein